VAQVPQPPEVAAKSYLLLDLTSRQVLAERRKSYLADPAAAQAFLKVGLTPPPTTVAPAELAAWTHVTRVLLNLHETITRE